ncbi:uncharacterized protein LOC109832518 [Asparagus officinalis]|uniref:uncharacterized protein LOC109832518 n=1 Tax=Asparagus officinalis TaxID=4686 RepID=UPI00098DF86E|nr:uncharacterized protein LOC109832518 [Asparagus officinalis]
MALIETKIKVSKLPAIARKIHGNWKWISNANNSSKARLLILILDVHVDKLSAQHVTCLVKSLDVGNKAWILCGDFNTITGNEDKLGGAMAIEAETIDFREFIDMCYLSHLKTEGCYFTWNNKQDSNSRVWSRLDRALTNDSWINLHNSSHVEYMLPSCSDHSPALVSIYDDCLHGKKPFKLFKMWIKHDNYLPITSTVWQNSIAGCAMFSVASKLKLLKNALKDLNKRNFHNISEQVVRARINLENVQNNPQEDPLNTDLINQEILLCFLQQTFGVVTVLYNSAGCRIIDGEGIIQELISFYKNLMGSATKTSKPDGNIISNGPCLNEAHARTLFSPVSKEEIKNAVFSMGDNKAPGPDGFSMTFYKSAWNIIGDEVTMAIEAFFKIGKLLANRIKSVMRFLINEMQSAFVKGRIMLSIDIKKAFDNIIWDFLNDMLKGLGFPIKMVN